VSGDEPEHSDDAGPERSAASAVLDHLAWPASETIDPHHVSGCNLDLPRRYP
jgi:hypothetical protein